MKSPRVRWSLVAVVGAPVLAATLLAARALAAPPPPPVAQNLIQMMDPAYEASWYETMSFTKGAVVKHNPTVDYHRLPLYDPLGSYVSQHWDITVSVGAASGLNRVRFQYQDALLVWHVLADASEANGQILPAAVSKVVAGDVPDGATAVKLEVWNDSGYLLVNREF